MSESTPVFPLFPAWFSGILFLVVMIIWCPRGSRAKKIGTIRCRRCGYTGKAKALGSAFSDSYGCPHCRSTDWEAVDDHQAGAECSSICEPQTVPEANRSLDDLTKKCPVCAETIKLEAKKCRYCGEVFDPLGVEKAVAAAQDKLKESGAQSERDRNAQAGLKDCPICGEWDVFTADDGNGGNGEWCPHCNKPVELSRIDSNRESHSSGDQDMTNAEVEEIPEIETIADEERPTFEITEDGCCPVCPKCGYERQPKDEDFSRIECPKCQVVYAKALQALEQKQCVK